jgi:hypothetical protein
MLAEKILARTTDWNCLQKSREKICEGGTVYKIDTIAVDKKPEV